MLRQRFGRTNRIIKAVDGSWLRKVCGDRNRDATAGTLPIDATRSSAFFIAPFIPSAAVCHSESNFIK